MADTHLSHDGLRQTQAGEDIPRHRFAQQALERNKREGAWWALVARLGALAVASVLLGFLNPTWHSLWYQASLVVLALIGVLQYRVGRVGHSRLELAVLALDLTFLTAVFLVPNPFYGGAEPTAVTYRFGNFQYYFIILAAAVHTYSWQTIIAMGNWVLGLWLFGAVCMAYFGVERPELTVAVQDALPNLPHLANMLDPNAIQWDLRIQQVVIFSTTAVILALAVRRFHLLVLHSAEISRERTNLARYFSPSMVEELSTKDEPLGQIRSHDAAVLFVDIVGFTSYSDGRPPEEVIETLRAFHALMEAEVFAHDGTLDKYLGDGLMATFGTPLPGPDDAARAVACVLAMAERMDRFNAQREAEGRDEIDARFGVHFGPVVLGDIGSNRLEFAVLGDTVNAASRLEALTRQLGVRMVISDATMQSAGAPQGLRRAPDQQVRGISEPLSVWVLDANS